MISMKGLKDALRQIPHLVAELVNNIYWFLTSMMMKWLGDVLVAFLVTIPVWFGLMVATRNYNLNIDFLTVWGVMFAFYSVKPTR